MRRVPRWIRSTKTTARRTGLFEILIVQFIQLAVRANWNPGREFPTDAQEAIRREMSSPPGFCLMGTRMSYVKRNRCARAAASAVLALLLPLLGAPAAVRAQELFDEVHTL